MIMKKALTFLICICMVSMMLPPLSVSAIGETTHLTSITIDGISSETKISDIYVDGAEDIDFGDLYTDATGKFTLSLPNTVTSISAVIAGEYPYYSEVSAGTATTLTNGSNTYKSLNLSNGKIEIYPDRYLQGGIEHMYHGTYYITGSIKGSMSLLIVNDSNTPITYNVILDDVTITSNDWASATYIRNSGDSTNPNNTIVNMTIDGSVNTKGYNHSGIKSNGETTVNFNMISCASIFTSTSHTASKSVDSAVSMNILNDDYIALVKGISAPLTDAYTKKPLVISGPHIWNSGTITVPATCTEQGLRKYTCTVCNDTKTETVPALGHLYGEWQSSITSHERVCEHDSDHTEIKAHTFDSDNICTICGYEKDTAKPVISINANGYADNTWVNSNVTLNISNDTSNIGNTAFEYSLNNGTWLGFSGTLTVSGQGLNAYQFRGTSATGVVGDASTFHVNIDKIAPTIAVTGNPTSPVQSAKLTAGVTTDESGVASVTVNGQDITASYMDGYTVTSNGAYSFIVTNGVGVSKSQTVTVTNIDTAKPVISISSNGYTNDTWVNTDVTLDILNTAENLSQTTFEYSLNGVTWTDFDGTITVSTDSVTSYQFRATSKSGVVSDVANFTVKVDKTSPINATLTTETNSFHSFVNNITFGLFLKETVDFTITSDDFLSGEAKTEYQIALSNETYDENGVWIEGSEFSVNPDKKFVVYARVTDNAGNTVYISTNGIITDSTIPELSVEAPSSWQASNVTAAIIARDALAGIKEVTYTTNETIPQQGTTSIVDNKGEIILSNEGTYTLTVTAIDYSGNSIEKTVDIKLDKTAPTIAITGNPSINVQSAALAATFTTGISGMASVKVNGVDITSSYMDGYTVTANGAYTFVVTNGAGVSKSQTIDVTNIDTAKPVISITSNGYTNDTWVNTDVTLDILNTTENLGQTTFEYSLNSVTWTDFDGTITVSTDSVTSYQFRATSKSGVVSDVANFTVKVDKTSPINATITTETNSFHSFVNTINYGLFLSETVDFTITSDDLLSGVAKTEYQIALSNETYDENGIWIEGSEFSVNPDNKFVVYAKVTDNVGNTVYISTDGIITDSTIPELSVAAPSSWQASNVTAAIIARDTLAGIKEVTYTTNETIPKQGTVSITNNKGYITLSHEGTYTLTVTAVDNSGNSRSITAIIKLDKTAPKIKTTENKTSPVKSAKLTAGVTTGISGMVSITANGQDITSSYMDGYTVAANGDYTFVVTNGAGVSNSQTVTVTNIDTAKPVISINSNGYTNDTWVNEDVTLNLVNTTQNLGQEIFEYSLNSGVWIAFDGTITVSQDSVTAYQFRAISKSGVVSDTTGFTVKLDKTSPVDTAISFNQNPVKTAVNFSSFGLFFTETVDVEISATDTASGIDRCEYQLISEGTTFDESGTWATFESLIIASDFKGRVYARTVDNVGNVSETVIKALVKDDTAPIIKASYEYSDVVTYDSKASIIINVTDSGAGVESITYQINSQAAQTIHLTDTNYNELTQEYIFTIAHLPNGTYDVVVSATDNSGNSADSISVAVNKASISTVMLTPFDVGIKQGDEKLFVATIKGQNNQSQKVIWSLTGNTSTNTTIDTTGRLTVGIDETSATLTVTATSAVNRTKHANTTAMVIPLKIIADGNSVAFNLSDTILPDGITSIAVDVTNLTSTGTNDQTHTVIRQMIGENPSLGNLDNLVVYDINMLDQDGAFVTDFTGKIKVSIPIPEGMSGNLHVLWYADSSGEIKDMNATEENGYMVFETTHFSIYAIAQLSATEESVSIPNNGDEFPIIPLAMIVITALGLAFIRTKKHLT